MGKVLKRLPSPSMAVAFVALLAALGGTAVALPGGNSVKKDDIAAGAVNSSDLRNNSVTSTDIRNSTIRGRDVRNSTITGADVAANTVTGSDVNEGTLGTVPSATSANSASSASNAGNADNLGGAAPNDYRRYTGTIPSGKTVSGAWGLQQDNLADNESIFVTVSFPVPAPTAPGAAAINFAPSASASDDDATCTGTATAPTAPAGKVCIYPGSSNSGVDGLEGFIAGSGIRHGFSIRGTTDGTAPVDADSRGTWAYTAP